MIPVTGLDAGAGKAGLIQSSATYPAGLECRKVLLTQVVTTIPVPTFALVPESETACEFAGAAHDSTDTYGSIWEFWDRWVLVEFVSTYTDFAHRDCRLRGSKTIRRDQSFHSFRSEIAAHPAELERCGNGVRLALA
jgi:hypothetical protein